MNINESKEFEAINKKVEERSANVEEVRQSVADTYRAVKVRKFIKATALMLVTYLALAVVMFGIATLEQIGWINDIFSIVMKCFAGAVAMFQTGYLWHEIKN